MDTMRILPMRKEFKIFCSDPEIKPDRLIGLFHFGRSENELAEVLDVAVSTVRAWKAGLRPVPSIYIRYLDLLDSKTLNCPGSPWHGAIAEGTRLIVPTGYAASIQFAEVDRLNEYRRLYHLHQLQSDLIERLMAERDFYRENCHRQAKFGLMLNNLFR